jgi:hypothetical protein
MLKWKYFGYIGLNELYKNYFYLFLFTFINVITRKFKITLVANIVALPHTPCHNGLTPETVRQNIFSSFKLFISFCHSDEKVSTITGLDYKSLNTISCDFKCSFLILNICDIAHFSLKFLLSANLLLSCVHTVSSGSHLNFIFLYSMIIYWMAICCQVFHQEL